MTLRLIPLIVLLAAATVHADTDPAIVAQHADALMSNDSNERIAAVVELEKLGADAEPALPALKAAMRREQDPGIKGLMIKAIASIEAAPRKQPRPTDIRGHAERVQRLGNLALDDSDLDARVKALDELASLGPIARPAHGPLTQSKADERSRDRVKRTVTMIGASLWFVDDAVDTTDSPNAELTVDECVVQITSTMWALAGKLADSDAKVRIRAIRDIVAFGAAAQPVLPTLVRIAESDPDAVARKLAGRAITRIQSDVDTTRGLREADE